MNRTGTGGGIATVDYEFIIACGYVFIQTAICAIGFILNLINFGVFMQPTFTAPTYIMMTCLSLADAATLGFRIPQGYIFFPRVYDHYTDAVVYVYVYSTYVEVPFTNMSENISAWLTVSLAIERYVTMKHWSVAKRYFTPKNTRRLVLLICIIAIIFNTPYFATQVITLSQVNETLELKSNLTSFYRSNYYATYSWLRIVLVQIIPLCFLCISNCLLFALVSQHNQRFSQREASKLETTEQNQKCQPVQHKSTKTSFPTRVSNYEPTRHTREDWSLRPEGIEQDELTVLSSVPHINGHSPQIRVPPQDKAESLDIMSNSQIPEVTEQDTKVQTVKPDDSSHRKSTHSPSIDYRSCEVGQRCTQYERIQKRRMAQKKLTILLIAVILLFLIGQVPQSLAYIRVFAALGICSTSGLERCSAHQFYRMITVNLSHLAFALNFFVYLFLNRDFRSTLISCTCRAKCLAKSCCLQNIR